jgi:benzoyl-CoA reductase subunit B
MSGTGAQRSRKDLLCTAEALAHQRQYAADLKRRVVEQGDPFVVAQADTPHELFHAMDIALITNQWWSAYISAKQLSGPYFKVLQQHG